LIPRLPPRVLRGRARRVPYGRGADPRALWAGGRQIASRLQEMISLRAVSVPADEIEAPRSVLKKTEEP